MINRRYRADILFIIFKGSAKKCLFGYEGKSLESTHEFLSTPPLVVFGLFTN